MNIIHARNKPELSVILPAYNVEKYISEAMNSILAQTFVDFELIAINDGSTDRTLSILQDFAAIDNRVRIITRGNKGLCESLNEGIANARGDYIARMDGDDISLPNRFDVQMRALRETGADICGCWMRIFGNNINRIKHYALNAEGIKTESLFGSPLGHGTVIGKRHIFEENPYEPSWERAEDYRLWVNMQYCGVSMINVPEVLYLYREHPGQSSSTGSVIQQNLSAEIRKDAWEKLCSDIKLSPEDISVIIAIRLPKLLPVRSTTVMSLLKRAYTKMNSIEAKNIVIQNSLPIFLRISGRDFNAIFIWHKLNRYFGYPYTFFSYLQIIFLSIFRINPGSRIYAGLEYLYLKVFKWG